MGWPALGDALPTEPAFLCSACLTALLAKYRAAIEAADRMRNELPVMYMTRLAYDRARSALPEPEGK